MAALRRAKRRGVLLVVGAAIAVGCSSFGSNDPTPTPPAPAEAGTTADVAVTDASISPESAPSEGSVPPPSIACGENKTCTGGEFCCLGSSGKQCVATGCQRPGDIVIRCDDSTSCAASEVCCVQTSGGEVRRITCEPRSACTTVESFERCRQAGATCPSCSDIKNWVTSPPSEFTIRICHTP
jgi:hypothetical protein